MALSPNRIEGEVQGHHVALWGSLFSGLETIALNGREVSRKRSFRFTTVHEISVPELGLTKAIVRFFPILSLELLRQDEPVAKFTNPWAVPLQVLIGLVGALLCVVAIAVIAR